MSAENSAGQGWRATVPVSVGGAPAAPQGVSAVRSGRNVTVSWKAPALVSPAPVDAYDVIVQSASGRHSRRLPASARTAVFKDLPAGTYRVVVRAHNAAGWSTSTGSVSVLMPAVTPPRPPAGPAAPTPPKAPAAAVPDLDELAHTGMAGSEQARLALGLLALGLALGALSRRLARPGRAD